ncbi:MAG: amidohydrolase family protein [Acidobacteria bacterium]|nr:amidohydrolase family protein [Acidobacteriota bacterium]
MLPGLTLTLLAFLSLAAAQSNKVTALTGARVITTPGRPAESATVVIRDGKITSVGKSIPKDATVIRLSGKTIIPGLVNAHGHMGVQGGAASSQPSVEQQLALYGRYGVTTVWSLGGENEDAVKARASQDTPRLSRARIYFAGPVIAARTPQEARQQVNKVSQMKPDVIKIRIDDQLGTQPKMTPDVYKAVIDEAHKLGYRVAVHIFYLDDAKGALRAGADFIAHSVRDRDVDDEFLSLMKARNICYCPTFTRELSTYVYESTPAFFQDPFFLQGADPALVKQLQEPGRQKAMRESKSAQTYKSAVPLAMKNLKRVADAGIRIAMGTDTGAGPGRFQGYFEHLEMEMMAQAGLTPAQVLKASTVDASACMGRSDVGSIEPGKWADLIVLNANPLDDIRNTRKIDKVWIAGDPLNPRN